MLGSVFGELVLNSVLDSGNADRLIEVGYCPSSGDDIRQLFLEVLDVDGIFRLENKITRLDQNLTRFFD